jgi:hypothetical protein
MIIDLKNYTHINFGRDNIDIRYLIMTYYNRIEGQFGLDLKE